MKPDLYQNYYQFNKKANETQFEYQMDKQNIKRMNMTVNRVDGNT